VGTTRQTAAQTAKTIEKIIGNEDDERTKHIAGKIDWLKNMLKARF
jgi:hypothetical protein